MFRGIIKKQEGVLSCFHMIMSMGTASFLSKEVLGFFLRGVLLSLDLKLWFLLVELHEFGEIELRLLEDLDLSHKDVLKWEDFSTLLLNLLTN
jgi:hypothetical protein